VDIARCATSLEDNGNPVYVGLKAKFGQPLFLNAICWQFLRTRAVPMPMFSLAMVDKLVQQNRDIEGVLAIPRPHEVDRRFMRVV
jgi:hypothetical protein